MLLKRQLLYQGCFKYIKAYKLVWVLSYPDSPRQKAGSNNDKRNKNHKLHWNSQGMKGKKKKRGVFWVTSCCNLWEESSTGGSGNNFLDINQWPSHSTTRTQWQSLYHLHVLFLYIFSPIAFFSLCSRARHMVPLLSPSLFQRFLGAAKILPWLCNCTKKFIIFKKWIWGSWWLPGGCGEPAAHFVGFTAPQNCLENCSALRTISSCCFYLAG